jgi:hypothetical protein
MTERRRLLAIVVMAVSVSTFDYVHRVTPDQVLLEHRAIVDGVAQDPYRYRILAPAVIDATTWVAARFAPYGTAFAAAEAAYDAVALMLMLALLYRYLRCWFAEDAAMVGMLLVACTMPIALREHGYSPGSLLEPSLMTAALLCVMTNPIGLVPLITVVATLNRETAVLIPLAVVCAASDRPHAGRVFVYAAASLLLWIATFVALRAWIGPAARAVTLAEIWHLNLSAWGRAKAMANVPLFAGVVGWLLALAGFFRAPAVVRRTAAVAVAYLPVYAVFGLWFEVRLLMPMYPILVPLMLSALYPTRTPPPP